MALAIPESCLTPSQPLFLPTCLPLASLLDFLLPLRPSCPSALGSAHHLDAANPQVLGPGHLLFTNPMFSLVGSFPHVASVTTTMSTTPQPLSLAQIFPCSLRSSYRSEHGVLVLNPPLTSWVTVMVNFMCQLDRVPRYWVKRDSRCVCEGVSG